MSVFLKLLFSLSLSGAVAVAALLLLQKLFYKKVSKCWRYYAWLIVFVRLILPLTPANSPIGNLFIEKEVSYAVSDVTVAAQSPVTTQAQAQGDFVPVQQQADFAAPTPHDSSPVVSISVVLAAIWGVVALMLFTRRLTQYQSFRQYLRAGSIPVADPALLDRYALMCERANISRVPPDLLVNPLITTPMLVGLCKPLIILPDTLADSELESILLHELMHYKRGDAVYKWFAQLVLCLHWFNPAAWIAVRAMERDCELACDEAVLNLLPPQQHRGYGNALLQAVQPRDAYPCKIARLAMGEDAKRLKERLGMIMDYRRRTRLEQGLAIVLTLTLCAGSVAIGAYAADAKGSSTPAAQEQSSTSMTVKADASTPQGTLELAMQAVQSLDIDALCRYSNNKKSTMNTIYSDSNHYNDKTKGPILFGGAFAASDTMNKELVRMLSWKIGKVSVSGDVATAELQITNRDFGDVIATIISNSLLESASGTSSEDFENDDMDLLVKAVPDSKTVTLTVTANLYKSNNQWRLYLNGKFANAVCGNLMDGVDSPASKAKVDAASKKLEESIEKSMDWEGMQKEVQEEVEAAMREREEALKELESSLNEMEASLNAEKPFLYFRF